MELAHGKNIPRQNSPRIGPPTIPNIFKATWGSVVSVTCIFLRLNGVKLCIYQQNWLPHQVGEVGHGQTQQPIGHSLKRRHTWRWKKSPTTSKVLNLKHQSSPKALDSRVALDSVMLRKCGLIKSSIVTVASELKAEEMVLQWTNQEKKYRSIQLTSTTKHKA